MSRPRPSHLRFPAAAAASVPPRSVLRIGVGPSPELLQAIESHPGGKLTVSWKDDPDAPALTGDEPKALSFRSWREEHHACSYCSRPFSVAYGNPPDQPSTRHNIAVRCPTCGAVVAVSAPTDVVAEELDVRPGRGLP